MVSLTEQVRVRAAVEELTTTPNTRSAAGATEDSISTSREPAGTGGEGGGGREEEGEKERKSSTKNSVSDLLTCFVLNK